ncbi:MAG: hypothetical protein ACETWE_05415 [Candidatus Bathyarchaeia archaeon]
MRIGILTAMILAGLLPFGFLLGGSFVHSADEYVYYGVVPARIYHAFPINEYDPAAGFRIDPETVATSGLVSIVAQEDNTNVQVYTLEDKALVSEAKLEAMGKHFVALPNGTSFKVVTSHVVSVMILGWANAEPSGASAPGDHGTGSFYTATDGGYVGKAFFFLALRWVFEPHYRILALENAEVTVTRENGDKQSFTLEANSYKDLDLVNFDAYKVESTGHIMVQWGTPGARWGGRSFFVPSAEGGFVGRVFYSRSIDGWPQAREHEFVISAVEDAKVTIWDVGFKRKVQEVEVKGGSRVGVRPNAGEIMVESDNPVTFASVDNGSISPLWSYSAAVSYMGVKPNEETLFFLPTNSTVEAYIFAYEDTLVRIDDLPITIQADSYFLLTIPGQHKIISAKNLVVQLIHWPLIPSIQGMANFGAVVPCIQTVNLTPNVELTPISPGEGFPTTYIMIGAAAAVAATAIVFTFMKRLARRRPAQGSSQINPTLREK